MCKSLKTPSIPAPPIPNGALQPDAQPVSATHFSTLRSEVCAGAIRVDVSNPEQWSPGKTAILRNQEAKQVRDIGRRTSPMGDYLSSRVPPTHSFVPPFPSLSARDGERAPPSPGKK